MLQLTLIKRERCEWKNMYFNDEFVALWWKSCEKSANVNVFLSVLRVPPKLLFFRKTRLYLLPFMHLINLINCCSTLNK